jgi:hypothetical protein
MSKVGFEVGGRNLIRDFTYEFLPGEQSARQLSSMPATMHVVCTVLSTEAA